MRDPILRFLHRHLWRRLPPQARRAALFYIASRMAPRITPDAAAAQPVIVVGLLRQASGLGAAARACHDAVKAAGWPVYGVDLTAALRHEVNYPEFVFADGRNLFGKGTVLVHVSGPLVPMALTQLGQSYVRDKRVIAHWFWETPRVPADWRRGIPFVHEICVNTRFVAEAIRPISAGRSVHVVPYLLSNGSSLSRGDAPRRSRVGEDRFVVVVVFNVASNFSRKNPCAAIEAFRRAFGDDRSTRLIVKYTNGAAWPEGVRRMQAAAGGACNIELIGDVLDEADMDDLYARADVVMSLHRAEGLGLVLAEAMQRGIPTVATDWSGNADFLTPETGVPVACRLVPIDDPQANYAGAGGCWAEPDIGAAAAALRALRADPALRARLGQAAAAHVATAFDPSRYVSRLAGILGVEGGGAIGGTLRTESLPGPRGDRR